mmetsp:Transcript_18030/g.35075  ORF Transcript_18030/g.35075 Transcript_18030/m.35075 type:complete len:97 (-) Transcript_18030:136-426(-)
MQFNVVPGVTYDSSYRKTCFEISEGIIDDQGIFHRLPSQEIRINSLDVHATRCAHLNSSKCDSYFVTDTKKRLSYYYGVPYFIASMFPILRDIIEI